MIQPFATRSGNRTSGEAYHGISSPGFSGLERDSEQPWSTAGTFGKLRVRLVTAPGVGNSRTFAVRVNGVDSAVSVTISGTATEAFDLVDTIAVAAGNRVSIHETVSGTPADTGGQWINVELNSTNVGESGYGVACERAISATTYFSPFTLSTGQTTEAAAQQVVPTAGDITRLDLRASLTTGTWTYTACIYKNGVKQDGTGGTVNTVVAIASSGSGGPQATGTNFTLPVVAGDKVTVEVIETGTGPSFGYACRFKATTDGESILAGGTFDNPHATDTEYLQPGLNNPNWNATESGQQVLAGVTSFTLGKWRILAATAPGSGNNFTFDLRRNTTSPAGTPTVTIADAATSGSDLVNTVSLVQDNLFNVRSVPSSVPTTDDYRWAMVVNTVPANAPPVVNAGADQTIATFSTNLLGSVTDDGLPSPPAATTALWTKISGPGTVTFLDDTDPTTVATFSVPGVYILRLTGSDSALTAFDEVQITYITGNPPGGGNCPSGPWTIKINGVDKTDRLRLENVTIEYTLGARGTLSCLIIDTGTNPAVAYRVDIEDLITVTKGIDVFHGRVLATNEEPLEEPNTGVGTRVEAVDYHRVLNSRLFTGSYGQFRHYLTDNEDGSIEVVDQNTVIAVATGNPAVVTTGYAHQLSTGDVVRFEDVQDVVPNINGNDYVITNVSANGFSIPVNVTTFGHGGRFVQVTRINDIFTDIATVLTVYGMSFAPMLLGPYIAPQKFVREWVETVLDTISRLANWVYRVLPSKQIEAFAIGTVVAPFTLSDANGNVIGAVPNRRTREDYANQVVVTYGPSAPGIRWEDFVADGTATDDFLLSADVIKTYGHLFVYDGPDPDGPYLLGYEGQDAFDWTFEGPNIIHWNDPIDLPSGTLIRVPYDAVGQLSITRTNSTEIANMDGEIYEFVIDAGEEADRAKAEEIGDEELAKRSVSIRTATVITRECLAYPGTVIPVDIPGLLMSGNWMVVSVRMTDSEGLEEDDPHDKIAFYTYELIEAGTPTTWIDYWKRAIG